LRENLRFEGIPRGMYKQHLRAVGICATSYADADSVTFYACSGPIEPWTRASRKGARVQLTLEHLMASLSIPFLFRPIFLHQQYFGDGAMRQTSPLSPAIHLGANRLLVIGVGDPASAGLGMPAIRTEPTFGQMFGFMLDSLFMDQLQSDLERIQAHNEDPKGPRIDCLVLTPSRDLSEIAIRHRSELPKSIRALLRAMGANSSKPSAGTLLSYLLFERGYTRELIALGLSDARARAEEIRVFLAQADVRLSAATRAV
jgi:NTE family protein